MKSVKILTDDLNNAVSDIKTRAMRVVIAIPSVIGSIVSLLPPIAAPRPSRESVDQTVDLFLFRGPPCEPGEISVVSRPLVGATVFALVVFFVIWAFIHIAGDKSFRELLYISGFWSTAAFFFAWWNLSEGSGLPPTSNLAPTPKPASETEAASKSESKTETAKALSEALLQLDDFLAERPSLPLDLPEGHRVYHEGDSVLKIHLDGGSKPRVFFTLNGKVVPVLQVSEESRVRWRYRCESKVGSWAWFLEDQELTKAFQESSSRGLVYKSTQSAYHAELDERWEFEVCELYVLLKYTSHFDDSP